MYLYNTYVILTIEKNGVYYRDIYDMTGVLISRIINKVIKDSLFTRKIDNNRLTITDHNIVKIK